MDYYTLNPLISIIVFNYNVFSAPLEVSLVGSVIVREGDNITLKCEHQSGFPASNGSLFFFNDKATYVEEVQIIRLRAWVIGGLISVG